jgi:hypothetical protein
VAVVQVVEVWFNQEVQVAVAVVLEVHQVDNLNMDNKFNQLNQEIQALTDSVVEAAMVVQVLVDTQAEEAVVQVL